MKPADTAAEDRATLELFAEKIDEATRCAPKSESPTPPDTVERRPADRRADRPDEEPSDSGDRS